MNSQTNVVKKFFGLIIIFGVILLVGIYQLVKNWDNISRDEVEISIIYAPESDSYLPEVIEDFNESYEKGKDPVTGKRLKGDDKKYKIVGEPGSSGTVHTQIVNALQGSENDIAKPTIFSPSTISWLSLVNYESGKDVFNLEESKATANAPVVMAIWESRLNLLRKKNPDKPIGWEDLIKVMQSENGWQDYSSEISRKKVYYGHTDPFVSSTALSTLMSEYFSSAKYVAGNSNLEALTLPIVKKEEVKQGVRDIESLIKHYSSRTTEFKEYIAQGPDYLDFVALEENDLIYINQGKTDQGKPPEKLVALYPKEGTFMHGHPFGILDADWVSDKQKKAAEKFTEYVLTKDVQKKVMKNGFRPANEDVKLDDPFTSSNGVSKDEPKVLLNQPDPNVIYEIQQSWGFVKKRGEVYLLVDTSGSMAAGGKMENAREAIRVFLKNLPVQDSIGLMSFSDNVTERVELKPLETNKSKVNSAIYELYADGSTAMFDGIIQTYKDLQEKSSEDEIIRAIVLLSDGADTASTARRDEVIKVIQDSFKSDNPVIIIPIAYGADADRNVLNAISRASATKVQDGDSEDIDKLLENISSYF